MRKQSDMVTGTTAPNRVWQNFMVMSTVAFFIIPLIVITLLYSLIGRTLRRANRIPNPDFQLTDQCSSRKIMKSRTIVVRLLGNRHVTHALSFAPLPAPFQLPLFLSIAFSVSFHRLLFSICYQVHHCAIHSLNPRLLKRAGREQQRIPVYPTAFSFIGSLPLLRPSPLFTP